MIWNIHSFYSWFVYFPVCVIFNPFMCSPPDALFIVHIQINLDYKHSIVGCMSIVLVCLLYEKNYNAFCGCITFFVSWNMEKILIFLLQKKIKKHYSEMKNQRLHFLLDLLFHYMDFELHFSINFTYTGTLIKKNIQMLPSFSIQYPETFLRYFSTSSICVFNKKNLHRYWKFYFWKLLFHLKLYNFVLEIALNVPTYECIATSWNKVIQHEKRVFIVLENKTKEWLIG